MEVFLEEVRRGRKDAGGDLSAAEEPVLENYGLLTPEPKRELLNTEGGGGTSGVVLAKSGPLEKRALRL